MALRITRRDRVVLDGVGPPGVPLGHRSVPGRPRHRHRDLRGRPQRWQADASAGPRPDRRSDRLRGRPAAGLLRDDPRSRRAIAAMLPRGRRAAGRTWSAIRSRSGLLKTPGGWGADIAVGEGQWLGLPLQFGGPGVGLMTCKQEHLRQLPGRIVGQTTDHDGRRGFVLTLQAREQHIRREKATSNICTSQTLLALGATIYLPRMGPAGCSRQPALSHKRARRRGRPDQARCDGYRVVNDGPFFNEFIVTCPTDGETMRHELAERGIIGGYALGRDYPGLENGLVLCATERTTDAEIDRLIDGLREIGRVSGDERAAAVRAEPAGPASATCCLDRRLRRRHARPARRAAARRAAAAGARRAGRGAPLHAPRRTLQLLDRQRVLPARVVHHEVQPEGQRGRRPPARASRSCTRTSPRRPSRARCELHARAAAPALRRSPASTPSRCSRPPARRASCAAC